MANSISDVDIFEPPKDLLDRSVEAYDENVPLLGKLAIGVTPQGLAIDAAEVGKYGRDAFRDFGSGDLGSGAMNLGIAGLSALGFIPLAGDLLKAGGKEVLKRAPQKFIDMRAKKLVPTKGNPTFEGPVRDMHPRLEKGLDRQMVKHQQDFANVDEMFKTAKIANKPFQKEIDDVAMNLNLRTAGSPGEVITDPDLLKHIDPETGFDIRTGNMPGTVKTKPSMKRKMNDKYDGDFTRITDPIRTRVIANTTQEADEFATVMARTQLPDGSNMLARFHQTGKMMKVASADVNYLSWLRRIARLDVSIQLDTGNATFECVEEDKLLDEKNLKKIIKNFKNKIE